MVFASNVLNPGLDPLYWVSMVLVHGLCKGLCIKRKGDYLAGHSCVEYLKRKI